VSEEPRGGGAGELRGRRALVAGASKGIGRACAVALARAGADVVVLARDAAELDALVAEIQRADGQAESIVCDALDEDRVRAAIDGTPPCDVMVNAVGTNDPTPFVDVTRQQYDRLMALNVRTAFFLLQHTAARLRAADRGGSLMTISSQMGHVGAPLRTVYCATKHAVEGLTKAAAVELAPHGIRVNTIAPTFIETEMTKPMLADPAFAADVLRKIPLGHLGQPEDVASAAVFLASDASRMVTGTSLVVDGGWTAS
jgi:NAD(P)-dependent dehydrogenase (short-subunit alcohol dehydrogenase family)